MLQFNSDYDFKIVLGYEEDGGEVIELYTNDVYDVRIKYHGNEISEVMVFPNTVSYNHLPNINPFYDSDAGSWRVYIYYQPCNLSDMALSDEGESEFLRAYTTCCGLGENACRTLINLLNTIEINLAMKIKEEYQRSILTTSMLDGILEDQRQDTEGEWS